MEYKVEEVSPVKRKVLVTVPAEEATAAIAATVALYRTSADIKGFRKGKVPSRMVESRYKTKIYQEATADLINYQINEILSELKINPLSRLNVDAGEMVRDTEFAYSFAFEVAPAIDLPSYVGLEVEEEESEVADGEVDAVIERIRDQMTELADVEDKRPAADGDVTIINFTAFKDGEPYGDIKADNFELPLGEGQALDGFEAIVKKLEPGQEGEGEITFPEDFINTELAGMTLTMKVRLHKIKKKVRPERDDGFAKKAGGFKDMEAMRQAIVHSYMETRAQVARSAAQKRLLDSLVAQVSFELPQSMVEDHVDRMVQDYAERMERQGKSLESLGKKLTELREDNLPKAQDLVRDQLFLMAVADKEGLSVTPEDVDRYLREAAIRARKDYETMRRYYEEQNLMFAVKDKLLADKAMDLIYEAAKVTRAPAASAKDQDEAGQAPVQKAAAKKTTAQKTTAKTPAPKAAQKAAKKGDAGPGPEAETDADA